MGRELKAEESNHLGTNSSAVPLVGDLDWHHSQDRPSLPSEAVWQSY